MSPTRCAFCHEPATDADGAAWAPSIAVERGLLCSPRCELGEVLRERTLLQDAAQRVTVTRRALGEAVAIVELVLIVGGEHPGDGRLLAASVVDWDRDGIDAENDGGAFRVDWRAVLDVRVVVLDDGRQLGPDAAPVAS